MREAAQSAESKNCSRRCFNAREARVARAKRRGQTAIKFCCVCEKVITGARRSVTCGDKCAAIQDRRRRAAYNREYHRKVRKDLNSGVRTNADWRRPRRAQLAAKAGARRRKHPDV